MELGQNKFFCSGSPVGRVDDYVNLDRASWLALQKDLWAVKAASPPDYEQDWWSRLPLEEEQSTGREGAKGEWRGQPATLVSLTELATSLLGGTNPHSRHWELHKTDAMWLLRCYSVAQENQPTPKSSHRKKSKLYHIWIFMHLWPASFLQGTQPLFQDKKVYK